MFKARESTLCVIPINCEGCVHDVCVPSIIVVSKLQVWQTAGIRGFSGGRWANYIDYEENRSGTLMALLHH